MSLLNDWDKSTTNSHIWQHMRANRNKKRSFWFIKLLQNWPFLRVFSTRCSLYPIFKLALSPLQLNVLQSRSDIRLTTSTEDAWLSKTACCGNVPSELFWHRWYWFFWPKRLLAKVCFHGVWCSSEHQRLGHNHTIYLDLLLVFLACFKGPRILGHVADSSLDIATHWW